MEPSEAILTIRRSVALSRLDHVRYVRLRGPGAPELLDRVFSRELYVRDGQIVLGLLLDEEGHVFADCALASDEDDFFLLTEGPDPSALLDHLSRHAEGISNLEIVDGTASHALISLDGPYAWELMARLAGQEVIGLPYLTFFHLEGFICCRSGKTGEYGYVLIVPQTQFEETWAELMELGHPLDVGTAGLESLDVCALENWFFNIRREGQADVTPLELQLQWRVSRRKPFIGSRALRSRLERGVGLRLTTVVSEGPLKEGEPVSCDGGVIGETVNAAFSPVRGDWVGLALLERAYALPGVASLQVGAEGIGARSVSPPVLNNRSLYVNPQVHSYASRKEDDFPPLVTP